MDKLTSAQRKWLRGMAHPLQPIVRLGQKGLTDAVIRQIDEALDSHELIKVQIPVPREEKTALAEEIQERTRSQAAGLVGHVLILYRENPDPEKRYLELP
jgi:RNA-binding protein